MPFVSRNNFSPSGPSFLALLLLVLGSGFLVCCNKKKLEGESTSQASYSIVCTTGMIADVARKITGEQAEVTGLIGEGVDPHLYQPSMRDTKALLAADLVFYNGLHLEGKMGQLLEKVKKEGPYTAALAEIVLKRAGHQGTDHDPHLWMNVALWEQVAVEMASEVSRFDPASAPYYESRLAAYQVELQELHRYAGTVLASIPESQRLLVTAHDAFGYMESAYGLQVRGIQGLSTESEAGLKELEELVSLLVAQKVPAIFVESSVSDKNVKALVEGARAKGQHVVIGGTLFSDAMGPSGSYEGTYVGMIDHNVTTIARALGGEAPVDGMNGRLTLTP